MARQKSRTGKPQSNHKSKYRKSNSRSSKPRERETEEQSPTNDASWYASDPALMRDSASYPFSWPAGEQVLHDLSLYSATQQKGVVARTAGICSLEVCPTIGWTDSSSDPVNVAAQAIYSFIRHANSGHSNYDPADLMLYILAMSEVYSMIVYAQRVYGYAFTFDRRNKYIGDRLIAANGIDPKDLRQGLAKYRFWINTLISKAASFAVPATMSYSSRRAFLYSGYYIEGPSIKDQIYQFVPGGYYTFELDSDQKGSLKWNNFPGATTGTKARKIQFLSSVLEYIEDMIAKIWAQEDFGIMSGDILKAYGNNIIKLNSVPEIYQVTPTCDYMVLTQMKNARILTADPSDITQTADGNLAQTIVPWEQIRAVAEGSSTFCDALLLTPEASANYYPARLITYQDDMVLTIDGEDPTPDVVMEATRLMFGYDSYAGEFRTGSEFVRQVYLDVDPDVDISTADDLGSYSKMGSIVYTDVIMQGVSSVSEVGEVILLKFAEYHRMFHFAPRMTFITKSSYILSLHDVDNYAVLDADDIANINKAAWLNMLTVPSVGKVM